MKDKKIKNYEAAMKELQHLVDELQGDQVSIDELSGKVSRAAELIRFCKEKLRKTEGEIGELF